MNTPRIALITGITGQDGSYLTELLLAKGYEVHGIIRRSSLFNTDRLDHLYVDPHQKSHFHLHYGDLSDAGALRNSLDEIQPDEVYNLGAQSHVRVSFDQPEYTVDVVGLGVIRLLEALRSHMRTNGKTVRYYQAGSSEMFGSAKPRQHEGTRFEPRSPYACAKVYGHYQVINHRESYGIFACNGILFNHESPRRGETFVTRKITRAATRIKLGLQDKLFLGNLDAKRDWGFAGDYVEAKVFGGGNVLPNMTVTNIGQRNSQFALKFLALENLPVVAKDLVDIYPRKVYFFPKSGKVLVKKLRNMHNDTIAEREKEYQARLHKETVAGEIELFG